MAHAFPGFRGAQRLHSGSRSAVDRVVRVRDARTVILKQPVTDRIAAEVLGRVQHEYELLRSLRGPPDQREQSPTAIRAALENTLTVARNEVRHVADVVTEFADIPDVVCHAGEINQVFLNLVVNAAHAIEDVVEQRGGRGTITIRTRREDADTVLVTVSDTGGGIPDAIRERVFDPFFTTKEVGRGTGQGLALARTAIVDRHGGTLSFETQLGEGTTFCVRLPIRGHPAGGAHTAGE